LNPTIPDWIVVNSNGGLLLSKCNGLMSVEDIATSFGAPVDDVETLFRRAIERGIVDARPNTSRQSVCDDKILIPEERPKSALPTFRVVHFKLTDDCNLRCRYCYAESGGKSDRLSLPELTRVAGEISEISSAVECVLSGGEPLLHPNVIEFAEVLKFKGHKVSLLTNGTLVNPGNATRIAAFSHRIKISLDGSTEDIHAMTRGRRNHATVVAAIDLLAGLGANVQVAMTVHKGNRRDIDAMAKRYGAMLTFQPLFPAGRGAERDDLHLTGSEYYEALASVENVAPMAAIASVLERLRGRGIKKCALADAEN
jgi:sulfatase maturation enzyme AslB (radical SAM superfamily)